MDQKKAVSILLTSTLVLSMLLVAMPKVYAQTTTVRFYASPYEIHNLNQIFTVACVVEDVQDLSAFVLQMEWDTALLEYQSHDNTYPASAHPAPNNPSPYAGVLTGTTSELPGTGVDPVLGIQRIDVFTLPATQFDGDGTIFTMTFKALNDDLYGDPTAYLATALDLTTVTLVNDLAVEIPRDVINGEVRLYYREFEYPDLPCLKVDPSLYEAGAIGETFDISVILQGADDSELSAFWDVAGADVVMHFDPTLIQALSVAYDPDLEFVGFWPGGLWTRPVEIDNVAGTVHIAFLGIPGAGGDHDAPYGIIRIFKVTFNATYESTSFPPPSAPITLSNPVTYTGEYAFDATGGLIDPSAPIGTEWSELTPYFGEGPFEVTSWEDNGDGELSPGDQFIMESAGGSYFDYHLNHITGTLKLQQEPFPASSGYFVMDAPTSVYSPWPKTAPGADPAVWDGHGNDNWFGNFALEYPAAVIYNIHVTPQIGAEYDLVAGVDYQLEPDGTVTLLHPFDEQVINEFVGTMPDVDLGWPALGYICSGIQSVWIVMPNGTSRFARDFGYAEAPPSEYWFDPDFPYELESWWATGYFPGPWTWPDGTEIYVNYTAPVWIDVDYGAMPDPVERYIEFSGSYADFLASMINPVGSLYDEAYPLVYRDYEITGWDDADPGGMLSVGDYIDTAEAEGDRTYLVEAISTDIGTSRKPWICENPGDAFFGVAPIVTLVGFPHPDVDYCPWHNKDYAIPLPHVVENGMYTAPFKPLGGFIDVYVCNYAPGFKGEGKDKPADMFWPQKEVMLCANVTYAGWPEQNKDVAFEIKFPNGTVFVVMYNRTDENGHTFVRVRLPWPCDDPEAIFGKWKVWATVDVACVVVNDTMEFKYDYRIHIWDVTTNKEEYKHCEDIIITVNYGSYLIQTALGHLIITVTVTDASGVPIGFDYIAITLGTDNMADWCRYLNGTVELSVHVIKWARPPIGTIYVGALTDFPQNGGCAETPVFVTQVSILAEWA